MKLSFYFIIHTLFLTFLVPVHSQDQECSRQACLRIPVEGRINTIDPGLTLDTTSIELTEQLFLGLTAFAYQNNTCTIVPELALRWETFKDGRGYRFYMRKDVFWTRNSTGERIRPVTAHDIVWALQRNISPKLKAPYASLLFILKNAKEIHSGQVKDISLLGVQAIDDHTIEMELTHPASYFPAIAGNWIFRPLPRESIESHSSHWTEPENIITNGPYMIKSWKKRKQIYLERNPHYYQFSQISIPSVIYRIVPQSFTGLDMYRKNKLDIIGGDYTRLSPSELSYIKSSPELIKEHEKGKRFSVYCMQFNVKRHPVDNSLVREAISRAINRKLLVNIITGGGEKPAYTFTPPVFLGMNDYSSEQGIRFSPKKAQALLKDAGYPDGKGFPELFLMHDISDTHTIIAQSVKTFLEHYLNIKITLIPKEWNDYITTISLSDKRKMPHMYRFGWICDYFDPNSFLHDAFYYSQNLSSWQDKTYDHLVKKAGETQNEQERLLLYQKAESILTKQQAVIVPLFYETANYLVKPWLKKWYPTPIGGQQIQEWSF